MKVSRQKINESYPTTASWLSDFEKSILKNADFLSNVKSILHNPDKKFSSVDEKLADLRERVGLDIIRADGGVGGSKTDLSSSAECSAEKSTGSACSSCSSGESCSCSMGHGAPATEHSKEDVQRMEMILTYISDMITSEPHLEESMVISKCRANDDLRFDELNIDLDMLKGHVGKLIGKYRENDNVAVKYVPYEPSQMEFSEDNEADYYRHAHT
tara:strand:+ start:75962 stop:76606 length:645 start_codon:yes stop_codon:yes gene_type:complete